MTPPRAARRHRIHDAVRLASSLIALLALLAATQLARASVTLALSLDELSRAAEVILAGEVLGSRAERVGGSIMTRSTIRVELEVAGHSPESGLIEVVTAGGEIDGVGLLVHGAPRLRSGERYLLFLRRQHHQLRCVGMGQGALSIGADPDSGQPVVSPARRLPSLVRRQGRHLVSAAPALIAPRPLSSVVAQIREARRGR